MLLRRKMFRKRHNSAFIRIIAFFAIFIFIVFVIVSADNAVDSIVEDITIKNAEEKISHILNKSFADIVKSDKDGFDKLIESSDTLYSDNSGEINLIKSKLILDAEKRLAKYKSLKTDIQLGSLTNSTFLSNRGPDIPIYFDFYCVVNADFKSSFTSAGINQTKQTLYISFSVDYTIIFNSGPYKSKFISDYIIGENVIIGETPSSYGGLYGISK